MKSPLLLAGLLLAAPAFAAEPPENTTLVTINGRPVTEMDFLVYQAEQGGGKPASAQSQAAMLSQLVNTVMIGQAAEAEGLDKRPEIVSALEIARYRLLAQAAVQHHLNSHPVSDAEIEKAYAEKYPEGGQEEYKARHILLKTKADAEAVIAELDKGADFATLAKARSTGPSASVGGDLGWFSADQMVAPFAQAAAALKKGSYSKEPVKTQFGWHVILLEDRRTSERPKLADVRGALEKGLKQRRIRDYMKQIRSQAKVELPAAEKK